MNPAYRYRQAVNLRLVKYCPDAIASPLRRPVRSVVTNGTLLDKALLRAFLPGVVANPISRSLQMTTFVLTRPELRGN